MTDKRKDCLMRHENGNCNVIGGFCTAVNDPICEGLHNAYDCGYYDGETRAKRQQEHPQWISVKDRLPETDGIYIVCDRRLNGYPWIHTVGFRKVSSSWCELHGVYYDDGYGRYSDQDKFTHWMPLPEPPEEDDHEN